MVPQEGNFRQIAPSPPAALVGCTRLSILHADPTRVGCQHAKQATPLRGASRLLRREMRAESACRSVWRQTRGLAPDGCCGRVAKWLENAYVAKYSNHSRGEDRSYSPPPPLIWSTPPVYSFGSRGPTSALTSTPPVYSLGRVDQPRLFRSVSQTCPYCRQECGFSRQLCKGCKGKRSPPGPSCSNPRMRAR